MKITFDKGGDFNSTRAAEAYLKDRGFSYAPLCGDMPRGFLLGDISIAKWRNLTPKERLTVHGIITGDGRNGPVHLELYKTAPDSAIKAFYA